MRQVDSSPDLERQRRRRLLKAGRRVARRERREPPFPFTGIRVPLPRVFSLTENPAASIEAILQGRKLLKAEKNVVYGVSRVHEMDAGAALLLLHEISNDSPRSMCMADFPKHKQVQDMIRRSGIMKHLEWLTKDRRPPPGCEGPVEGMAMQASSNKVLAKEVAPLIEYALDKAGLGKTDPDRPRRRNDLYDTLVETMANTVHHASRDRPADWWVTVVPLPTDGVAFAFMDFGDGILNTVVRKYSEILKDLFASVAVFTPDPTRSGELLGEVMEGELTKRRFKSRTGKAYRGEGLPGIRQTCLDGGIQNLHVLSNAAHGKVAVAEYQTLDDGVAFPGTFFYWEFLHAGRQHG